MAAMGAETVHNSVEIGIHATSQQQCCDHSHSHANHAGFVPNLPKKVTSSHELRSDFIRHKKSPKNSPALATATIVFMGLYLFVNTMATYLYLHPNLYSKDSRFTHGLIFGFALVQVLLNWYKTCSVNSSFEGVRTSDPNLFKSNWTFCLVCNHERPPRCTHCFECNKCVLKRDHHCFLFSTCIGHFNMRYFFVFTFYLLYISMIVMIQSYDVIVDYHLYAIDEMTHAWYLLVLCIPGWCIGLIFYGHTLTFALILVLQLNFAILVVSIFYSGWLLNLLFEGQTSYEALHDVRQYSRGWRANIRQVFGTSVPVLYFLFPFNKRLPSDGLYWEQRIGELNSL